MGFQGNLSPPSCSGGLVTHAAQLLALSALPHPSLRVGALAGTSRPLPPCLISPPFLLASVALATATVATARLAAAAAAAAAGAADVFDGSPAACARSVGYEHATRKRWWQERAKQPPLPSPPQLLQSPVGGAGHPSR